MRDTTAECVALRKRARRRLRGPAGAKAIVRPAPGRDGRRDSDVALAIAPRSCELAIPFAKSTCQIAALVTAPARRSRQCRQFAGPSIPSKHDHTLRRHGRYRRSPRLRSPSCRFGQPERSPHRCRHTRCPNSSNSEATQCLQKFGAPRGQLAPRRPPVGFRSASSSRSGATTTPDHC